MKTSIKLNLKAKKLKTLSKEQVQKVGGAGGNGTLPQQMGMVYLPKLYSVEC